MMLVFRWSFGCIFGILLVYFSILVLRYFWDDLQERFVHMFMVFGGSDSSNLHSTRHDSNTIQTRTWPKENTFRAFRPHAMQVYTPPARPSWRFFACFFFLQTLFIYFSHMFSIFGRFGFPVGFRFRYISLTFYILFSSIEFISILCWFSMMF